MAKKTKDSNLSLQEKLEQALIPNWDEPYKLPDNWCWTHIEHCCRDFFSGKSPKYSKTDTGYHIIGQQANQRYGLDLSFIKFATKEFAKSQDTRYWLQKKDVILNTLGTGSIGRSGIIKNNVNLLTDGHLFVFRTNQCVVPEYLYYFFQLTEESIIASANGSTNQKFLSLSAFSQTAIPLPPLAEQRRIVACIESLFAKLDEAKEKAQEVVDGFETRKAAILHKAFSGELTQKWREENGFSFAAWEHHNFSDLCKIVRGGSPRPAGSPEFYGGDIPFMKVADITRITSPYVESTEHFIKPAGLKKTRMVKANTLLLTNSGATLGVPAICTFNTTFNDGIAAFLNLPSESLLFYYYFWTMKTPELRAINKGAAQPNLNTDIIGAVELDVPSLEEQKVITNILEHLITKEQQVKESAEAVVEQIDTMKKAILARAFRGELGTNDPSEENAVELLKNIFDEDEISKTPIKKPTKRIMIPADLKGLLSNVREEKIIKLLLKFAPQPVPIQEIMSLSSKKFDLMESLRTLENKQLITKNELSEYSLMR